MSASRVTREAIGVCNCREPVCVQCEISEEKRKQRCVMMSSEI